MLAIKYLKADVCAYSYYPVIVSASYSNRGFTLIELLTVGQATHQRFSGYLDPICWQSARWRKQNKKSANNMRSIAISYATYSASGGRVRTLSKSKMEADADITYTGVAGVAQIPAKHSSLTGASIWIIGSDPLVAKYADEIPAIVGFEDEHNIFKTAPTWKQELPLEMISR